MLDWIRFEAEGQVRIGVVASEIGIRAIELNLSDGLPGRESPSNPMLRRAAEQLRDYFAGALTEFEMTLDMQGTEFQKRVWKELLTIPYGETRSYSDIAQSISAPKAVRAV